MHPCTALVPIETISAPTPSASSARAASESAMKVFPSRRGLPLISSTFIIAGISCKNNHFFHSPYTFRAESKTAWQFRAATKKGDSEESPSLSSLTGDYLFASAFSQHDFSQQALVESAFAAQLAQAEASVAAAAAAPSAAFLFEFPQQPTIATAARTMTKETIFFMALNI